MPDRNHTQQPEYQQQCHQPGKGQGQPPQQRDQDSPFGGENREKRWFKILPLNPTEENVSYEVIATEDQQTGATIIEHINKRFTSAGVEINPTTPIGKCERCHEVNLADVFRLCNVCGWLICVKCQRKFLGKTYCRWSCFFAGVLIWLIKLCFMTIVQIISFTFRLLLKVIGIPLKDILQR